MKKIGQGSFSKVYLQDNGKVYIKSIDYIKECLSLNWNGLTEYRLFPQIDFIKTDGDYKIYEMEYYEQPKSLKQNLNPHDYKLYKTLRKVMNQFSIRFDNIIYDINISLFDILTNCIADYLGEFEAEQEILIEAINTFSNYGQDICFEISPRNVAVKNNQLILLDCFFFRSQLLKIKNK